VYPEAYTNYTGVFGIEVDRVDEETCGATKIAKKITKVAKTGKNCRAEQFWPLLK